LPKAGIYPYVGTRKEDNSVNNYDERDDFWDVSRLVPKKKSSLGSFATSAKIGDVVIDAPSSSLEKDDRRLDFSDYRRDSANGGERSYIPASSRLIKRVTVKPSVDRFDFYGTFRKAALIYYEYKCQRSEFVPFYSYKPQYTQMTDEQKRYYFYWRDEVRSGRYHKTDYSYLYLYVYEILNLPEKIPPDQGLIMLARLWREYRRELPKIDQSFALWMQDYCLVYELDFPFEEIGEFIFDIINASAFKEFYLSPSLKGVSAASAMIAYLSDYDWRRGKYAGGDNADTYRLHLEGAMSRIFSLITESDALYGTESALISRTAFQGSLCTHSVKCILDIEYYPISGSTGLRAAVTAAVRYTENKLRACIGVKSRISVGNLPDEYKRIIDEYFEGEFARLRRERERANAPEYEKLYISEETDISFENALEIERASWNMTARLVEGIEEYEDTETPIAKTDGAAHRADEQTNTVNTEPKDTAGRYGLSEFDVSYIAAIADGRIVDARNIAASLGESEDTVAERINNAFADNFGDVILEISDSGYVIIEDYYEEIIEWIR